MAWVGRTCSTIGGEKCIQTLVRKPERKRHVGDLSRDGRIMMNLEEIGCEGVN
jgi:hypothetical protein